MNLALKQWLIGLVEAFLVGGTSAVSANMIGGDQFSIYHQKFWEMALTSGVLKMALYVNSTLSHNKDVQQALMTTPPPEKVVSATPKA